MNYKLYKTKEDIKYWLDCYYVTDYSIIENEKYNYVVNVNTTVNLNFLKFDGVGVKFNHINGDFHCINNSLVTMYGFPEKINGSLKCTGNKLNSLEYCPKHIEKDFIVSNNNIQSLIDFPIFVGGACDLTLNENLKEIQNLWNFKEIRNFIFNNKLEKEIIVNDYKNNPKIKL